MKQCLFKINCLLVTKILIYLTLFTSQITAFEEDSIFEDEDIYSLPLPPPPPLTGLTLPGTKWCGPGHTSSNYNDLGRKHETDMCCRDHDKCDDILRSKSSLHGLNNIGWFSILKCSCEQKFVNCLQAVNNEFSHKLGRIYYGARRHCFDEGYPIISCEKYQRGTIRKRCVRYKIDKKGPKIWQFYDMPFYVHNVQNTTTR